MPAATSPRCCPTADPATHLHQISFFGIEKLHPFDSCKFQKVVAALEAAGCLQGGGKQLVQPLEASQAVLSDLHTPAYLNLLHTTNLKVVQVTELPPLLLLPPALVQWKVRGWAINLGGGMHHAYYSNGMGWCPYDDITLAIRRVRAASQGKIQKVLYIDLDAHQGNGIGRDKLHFKDNDLFILDMYNGRVFPQDDTARPAIDIDVQLTRCTDILEGDPLGRMKVTREGVLARDAMVWSYALKEARAPIVMTLSGGYARSSAAVVSESIVNLMRRFKLLEDPPGSGSESAGPGS
ncbi:hist_deacetyl domain-containing protein [Haematococcus lacustris]|uniref:Hist_deacetyl domain-containing protein n=1 Tax=Haematococcus lacustris TaxID=44745 RepID=A0A699YIQ2_HAELA|nr:hist_deacetyl domain-containing protein [Haematococcus lacustris]